uniref:(northern house mosquito) hypothetical protein n=1 Tax=Culex pipiens TaxID=7175 RepID=A0A8D8IX35_CULPI
MLISSSSLSLSSSSLYGLYSGGTTKAGGAGGGGPAAWSPPARAPPRRRPRPPRPRPLRRLIFRPEPSTEQSAGNEACGPARTRLDRHKNFRRSPLPPDSTPLVPEPDDDTKLGCRSKSRGKKKTCFRKLFAKIRLEWHLPKATKFT